VKAFLIDEDIANSAMQWLFMTHGISIITLNIASTVVQILPSAVSAFFRNSLIFSSPSL